MIFKIHTSSSSIWFIIAYGPQARENIRMNSIGFWHPIIILPSKQFHIFFRNILP
jgi:hypothetical protein